MYREPRICTRNNDLSKRWYVELIFNGKRLRFYNGKKIGLELYPNRSRNRGDRERQCYSLYNSIREHLARGWNPVEHPSQKKDKRKVLTMGEALDEALRHKLRYPLSDAYHKDLKQIARRWKAWVTTEGLSSTSIKDLESSHLDEFLLLFNTGSTYYRTQRRTLSALFGVLVNLGHLPSNPVSKTTQIKREESLHLYYTFDELIQVLDFIKSEHRLLHLACLMTYGCLLRPHKEIRLLTRGDFSGDMSTIVLKGQNTKNGKIRKVKVPEYVVTELNDLRLGSFPANYNIFSMSTKPFGEYYFSTAWSRAKTKMLAANIIKENQTLYSFRHSAAVQLYKQTNSLHTLKVLMGHSDLQVTLKYLRSLGIEESRQGETPTPKLK